MNTPHSPLETVAHSSRLVGWRGEGTVSPILNRAKAAEHKKKTPSAGGRIADSEFTCKTFAAAPTHRTFMGRGDEQPPDFGRLLCNPNGRFGPW